MNSNSFDNWKNVWLNKSADDNEKIGTLERLIKANGFDSNYGDYSTQQWKKMVLGLAQLANIKENDKVFEVGCGSGALLYELNKITKCDIFGVDYSQSLIESAKKYVAGTFEVSEANNSPFSMNYFDIVLSHSVFHYFPSLSYSLEVINLMYNSLKSGGTLLLMDLNNIEKEQIYHLERSAGYENTEEYNNKYKNHNHLFFDKNKLINELNNIGFINTKEFSHSVPEYKNSQFRFNLIAHKK